MKIEGIIFDLDNTLVYSDPVMQYREQRNWNLAIKNFELTQIYPNITEMLSRLRKLKIKCGIATSSPRKYSEALVSFHNLNIAVLVAYQDTGRHKPSPDPILKAASKLNLLTRNILHVGDQDNDITAGKNAGTFTAVTGWTIRDSKLCVNPDYIIDNPLAIMDIINSK